MRDKHLVYAAWAVLGIGLAVFAIKQLAPIDQGSYKDKTEGKNNIVRPGGAMKPGKKVYQIWSGAYTSVDPLTRSL